MKRNIFAYRGRATRQEFWMICLGCIVTLFIAGPVIDSITDQPQRTVLMVLYILLVVKVLSAVTTRRCHDLGLSGWGMFNPKNFFRIPFEDSANDIKN